MVRRWLASEAFVFSKHYFHLPMVLVANSIFGGRAKLKTKVSDKILDRNLTSFIIRYRFVVIS
jgi:hypothetical protein